MRNNQEGFVVRYDISTYQQKCRNSSDFFVDYVWSKIFQLLYKLLKSS